MSVYIEVVILDNFLITFLAATAAFRFLSLRGGRLRRLIAAAIGTAAAVCYPLLRVEPYVFVAIKLVLCILLSLVLFLKRCNVIKGAGAFLLVTFFFGGAIFSISLMICGDPVKALKEPVSSVPPSLFISLAIVLFLLAKRVVLRFKKIGDATRFVFDLDVTLLGKTERIKGFLDTGNRLYDSKSGLPIIVLSARACVNLLSGDNLRYAVEKQGEKIAAGAHYIDYTTLNSKTNRMLVLKPDAIVLYSSGITHTIKDIMVGLSFFGFSDTVDYDAILHPSIIKT